MNLIWAFEFLPKGGQPLDFKSMEESAYLGPIIKTMQECKQSEEFHKEGDVWQHTKLTMEHLRLFATFKEASSANQSILLMSALLHDVGKTLTSKAGPEGITSKGHSVSGARLVRESIIQWNSQGLTSIPFLIREQICNMVLLHMIPGYAMDKEDPLYSIFASSQVVNNNFLATLAMSDLKGRICENEWSKPSDMIQLFSLFCEENECFETPKKFPSDRCRFRYFFERKGHPDYDYFEPVSGQVIVMSGLQAAGKDHIIKTKYPNWNVISLDQTRTDMGMVFGDNEGQVSNSAKEACRMIMRDKQNFIFNATNLIKDIRSKWIRLFRQYHYQITIHYVERPLSVIIEANKKRENKVPEGIILEKVSRMDIPTAMECHNLVLDVE